MNLIAGLSGLLDLSATQKLAGIGLVIWSAYVAWLWIIKPEVFR